MVSVLLTQRFKLVLLHLLLVFLLNATQEPVASFLLKLLHCVQPVDGHITLLCKHGTDCKTLKNINWNLIIVFIIIIILYYK